MKRDTYRITYHDGTQAISTSDARAFAAAHGGCSVEIKTKTGWVRADVYMDDAERDTAAYWAEERTMQDRY